MHGFSIIGMGEQGPDLAHQLQSNAVQKSTKKNPKSLDKQAFYPGLPVGNSSDEKSIENQI